MFRVNYTKTTRAKFSLVFVVLAVSAIVFSRQVGAGWFGYDSYEECINEEEGKLMSRWINPLSQNDARQAAFRLCNKYPSKYELRLQAMTLSELKAELDAERQREKRCKSEKGVSDEYMRVFVGFNRNNIEKKIERRKE